MSNFVESPAAAIDLASPPASAPQPAVAPHATAIITPDQAVEKCMTAYKRAFDGCAAKGEHQFKCDEAGGFAFRVAMPSTGSIAEIQAFVACITRGIHLRIWRLNEPAQLFSAARIALSTHQRESAKGKKQI